MTLNPSNFPPPPPPPPVMSADEAAKVARDITLPPAGATRDEELARRKDELEQRIDEQPLEAINPKALLPDSELQGEIARHDMLEVDRAQPGRVYAWIFTGTGGVMIWRKKAEGWQVVQGADPECMWAKHEDSTRRVGDTILMWISQDRFNALEARRRQTRELQIDGITSEARELAMKSRGALVLHEDPNTVKLGRSGKTLGAVMESRASALKSVATQGVDQMLRKGTVPGMAIPGAER